MKATRKLKILFLITDLGKGGAERFLIDLCEELINYENIEFMIGSLFDLNEYKDLTKKFNVRYLDFQTFRLRGENENPSYKKILEEFQPDIVHTHRFLGEFLSSYYVSNKITYICHGHDNMVQFETLGLKTFLSKENLFHYIEKRWLLKKKYKKAKTYFVVNSEDTRTYFIKNLPASFKNKIVYIPMGFNYDRFYHGQNKSISSIKKIKILNVGSFQDKKNQAFLINIGIELRKRNIDFEINMIGNGKNFNLVSNLIIENGLEDHIFMRGLINNVEQWYKETDLYVHTAYYEPFGLVFLEAMASGTPIIALDGKGNRDLIQNGVNGFMLFDQEASQFADKIEMLINNPSVYEKISEEARQFAEKYDVKKRTQELVDFYYSVD